MTRRIVGPLCILVIAAGVATAAARVSLPAADAVAPPPYRAAAVTVNDLAALDGGYELHHPRHRAKFLTNGIEVSPRGGSPAWTWQLARIRPAGSSASFVENAGITPDQPDALVVRYDRVALDEEYVLGETSIEQRFVLHVPPPLDGSDLVIEGTVTCDGSFLASPQGWEWRGDGGVVWLGPAVVFDADGTVLSSRFEVTATSTRLVIDGPALHSAAYPVIIDPEIGANDFRISDMGPDGDYFYEARYPATAMNESSNEYLVVWSGDNNVGGMVVDEREIFGQLLDARGVEIHANDFRISDVGGSGDPYYAALYPDVAWNSTRNQYLVVWQADDPKDGCIDNEYEVWGQLLDSNGGGLGPNDFRISHMGPDGNADFGGRNPAVTYNPVRDEYLVVWSGDHNTGGLVDDEYEIWAQRVSWDGALAGPSLRMSDMGGTGNPDFDASSPDVVWNSQDNEYLIVWYGDDNTGGLVVDEAEVYGQLIDDTGGGVGPNDYRLSDMGGIGNPSFAAVFPTVAYNPRDNEYLVVWYGDDNVGGLVDGEYEVFSQRLTADLVGVGPNDYRLSDAGGIGNPTYSAFDPRVAYNSATNEYAVVWWGDDTVGGTVDNEFEVYCQLLTADIVGIGPNDARVSDIGGLGDTTYGVDWVYRPLLAVAANSNTGEFFAVWTANDPAAGMADWEVEVYGQRVTGSAVLFDGFESGDTAAWSATVP